MNLDAVDVMAFLVGSGAFVVLLRSFVGVTSGVGSREPPLESIPEFGVWSSAPVAAGDDVPLNHPARPPRGLSAFPFLASPVRGICSEKRCVLRVGDGVRLRKDSGSRVGKDCWRR